MININVEPAQTVNAADQGVIALGVDNQKLAI